MTKTQINLDERIAAAMLSMGRKERRAGMVLRDDEGHIIAVVKHRGPLPEFIAAVKNRNRRYKEKVSA